MNPNSKIKALKNIEFKPIGTLFHDPDNPRLPSKIKKKAGDVREVIRWMIQDSSLPELMRAIAQIGFSSAEPLLVVKAEGESEEKYYVVEGNRRLTAVKLIIDPSLAEVHKSIINEISDSVEDKSVFSQIPVIVYDTRDEILDYLGYRHITGIREWFAFEKAQYLEEMSNMEPYNSMPELERFKALSNVIGSRSDYVARLLTCKNLYDFAEEKELLDEADLYNIQDDFSLLTTSLLYKSIANYLSIDPKDIHLSGLNVDNFKDLVHWIFKRQEDNTRVVQESRRLKELAKVVENVEATAYLKKNNDLLGAYQITSYKDPLDSIRNQIRKAEILLNNVWDGINNNKELEFSVDDISALNNLDELIERLRKAIKTKLN